MTTKFLKVHIVSDVHLNDKRYDRKIFEENPEKDFFREFLTSLNKSYSENDQGILILNGDILDITSCWYESTLPWDTNTEKVETILKNIITRIIENNISIIEELKLFLKHPLSKIVYVIGNHDSLLGKYKVAQELIAEKLLENLVSELKNDRISFVDSFEYPKLGLYVEHGHRFDPLNTCDDHQPCFGDVISILIVNHSVESIVDRLKDNGYSPGLIANIESNLYDIEYIRPLSLLPFWIESLAHVYRNHPECQGKTESIQAIFRKVILNFHYNPWAIRYLSKKLHLPRYFLRFSLELMLRCPPLLPALSFLMSKLLRRTHSNNFQHKMAKKLYDEKNYRMIVFGHTHIPIVTTLGATGHYCNTGSWTPVINLLKYSENKSSYMEYLIAESEFSRIEHSGTLNIELNLSIPGSKPKFSLKTIQRGVE